jgi:galactokinase
MTASGESSIHNYECGSPPLIDLHRLLVETDGVYGARFSGAGFGGCCVALVRPEAAEKAASRIREQYARRYPDLAVDAPVVLCDTDDGATIVEATRTVS